MTQYDLYCPIWRSCWGAFDEKFQHNEILPEYTMGTRKVRRTRIMAAIVTPTTTTAILIPPGCQDIWKTTTKYKQGRQHKSQFKWTGDLELGTYIWQKFPRRYPLCPLCALQTTAVAEFFCKKERCIWQNSDNQGDLVWSLQVVGKS